MGRGPQFARRCPDRILLTPLPWRFRAHLSARCGSQILNFVTTLDWPDLPIARAFLQRTVVVRSRTVTPVLASRVYGHFARRPPRAGAPGTDQLGRIIVLHYTLLCQNRFDMVMDQAASKAAGDPSRFRLPPQVGPRER